MKGLIRRAILRWRNNRKISRALASGAWWPHAGSRRRRGLSLLAAVAALAIAAPAASANPAPQGQELYIYAGGGAIAYGDAYGSEHTDARVYYDGYYHGWVGCSRSTYNVHLWVCIGLYIPPGRYAFAELAYHNANGWSYGDSPWVWSYCCQANQATTGVLG